MEEQVEALVNLQEKLVLALGERDGIPADVYERETEGSTTGRR